jgi:hypothetical protein
MRAAVNGVSYVKRRQLQFRGDGSNVTLLELVQAIADVTDDDREIVATVMYLLRSRRVRLIGNFRDWVVDAA